MREKAFGWGFLAIAVVSALAWNIIMELVSTVALIGLVAIMRHYYVGVIREKDQRIVALESRLTGVESVIPSTLQAIQRLRGKDKVG